MKSTSNIRPRLSSLKPEQQAHHLDKRVRTIEKQNKRSYIELGQILCKMQDGGLWKFLKDSDGEGFRTFEQWLMHAAPVCRAGAYQAMRALRELKEIPVKDLKDIDRANVETLREVPRKNRAALIEDAKQLSNGDFRKKIQKQLPEAHIESLGPMKFKPTESQREKIEETLEVVRWVFQLATREEALECLAVGWMDEPCELEDYVGQSNREAWESWRKRPFQKAAEAEVVQ